jgi:pimeloyl-ACP methyl ester carboxylesterase
MEHHARHIATALLLFFPVLGVGQAQRSATDATPGNVMDSATVARLLTKPTCLATYVDSARTCVVEDSPVLSKGIVLSGQLYLPTRTGRWPLVILVHGGFNETELIMQAPRYYAPRLAHCGFAAYVFWKRGTGQSGGVYADASNDDFIDDVVNIAEALASNPHVDRTCIGVCGGSAGALLAPLAAARSGSISFVIGTSGPIVSAEEESNFNIETALRTRGYPDSLVQKVMPLWRRHHAAWARSDTAEHEAVAAEVYELRKQYDPLMLPTPYRQVFADSGLVFMWPAFRSAHRDYLAELRHLKARWLSIYGERDEIVPVPSCVRNVQALMKESGNKNCDIIVFPNVDHSLINREARTQVPIVRIIINWLNESVLNTRK